ADRSPRTRSGGRNTNGTTTSGTSGVPHPDPAAEHILLTTASTTIVEISPVIPERTGHADTEKFVEFNFRESTAIDISVVHCRDRVTVGTPCAVHVPGTVAGGDARPDRSMSARASGRNLGRRPSPGRCGAQDWTPRWPPRGVRRRVPPRHRRRRASVRPIEKW